MTRRHFDRQNRIPWYQRILLVAAGSLIVLLLLVAAGLPPDPSGLGTHQRLGLPPCSFRQLTGWRCPSCGMTTSWSLLVRGQVAGAFGANAGGALLGLLCLPLAPWSLVSGLTGRWFGRPVGPEAALAVMVFLLVMTLADWLIRLWLPAW